MAVCWLSARTCSLLPSSLCFSWFVSSRTQLRLSAVSGTNVVANAGNEDFAVPSPVGRDLLSLLLATTLKSRWSAMRLGEGHPPLSNCLDFFKDHAERGGDDIDIMFVQCDIGVMGYDIAD
jgi:hypothetical protein